MHRFFVAPEAIDGSKVSIKGKQAYQISRVLRMKPGDEITVLDNSGAQYQVKLAAVNKKQITGDIVYSSPCPNEPSLHVHLYQALLKGDKFDFVLQKCTEIGVASFTPIICERSISRHVSTTRMSRWQTIIMEAAEQSHRARMPLLQPLISFTKACHLAMGVSLLAWEGEKAPPLRTALPDQRPDAITIFIGPEGGFSFQEVEFARSKGITPVTLGKRILRAETAALVAASIVLYEYGDLGC